MADVTTPLGFPYPEDTDLVRDGASDIENLAEGVNDYLTGGYLLAGTRYYTSSGTFAKADPLGTGDIGLRAVRVRLVGGGGAGGGSTANQNRGGTGGGGGGFCEAFITNIAGLATSVTVTVGAGGAGVSGDQGSAGGNSSFQSRTGNGGSGGNVASADYSSAVGGDASGGNLNIRGGAGGIGGYDGPVAGAGGSSQFAGARNERFRNNSSSAGFPGNLYGGGGSGAQTPSSGLARAGGDGAAGIVIVEVFV